MPYKDPEKQKEAIKKAVQKYRGLGDQAQICNTPKHGVEAGITKLNRVMEPGDRVIPDLPSDALKAYISRPSPGMANLERLQRLSGSLGKYGSQVFMGNYTIEEIGKAIGVLPPLYPRS
uniref:Uncharacterized protein n=1 Tax=viral metagenome TaxID=1070528 RepID=A0A6H2A0K0_9ZZZZ